MEGENVLCVIDLETRGLDATKYITGGLLTERAKSGEIYRNSNNLWKRVIDLGIKEAKRGKVLNIYSHNAQYDTAGYVDFRDKHMVFFSNRPLIWAYRLSSNECDKLGIPHNKGKGKEIIKFLDSYSIFRMPLKELGEIIGLKKLDTPLELLEKNKRTEEELRFIEDYMMRDCFIVMKALFMIKQKLKDEGVNIRRLYTINQIAINNMLNYFKRLDKEYVDNLFWVESKNELRQTYRKNEIHCAYRGGRVELFKSGKFDNVNYIDCNSLYPYSATKMRFPELKSERKHWKPLERGWTIKKLFKKIGLSRCLVKNVSCKLGLLPIRTPTGSYVPKEGTSFIGTWTHFELGKAIKEGYEIVAIEWSVVFDDAKNPFKHIFPKLYSLRKDSKDPFDNYFYKCLMNSSIGKFAQNRKRREICIDDVEKFEEYSKKMFRVVKGIDLDYMYQKEVEDYKKPYYCPIIPTLINAWARCYMFDFLKKVEDDVIYCDTDSIIWIPKSNVNFKLGKDMGFFKFEYKGVNADFRARKIYRIGDEIKMSGISKMNLTLDSWNKGKIKNVRQVTLGTTSDLDKIGTFNEIITDLSDIKSRNDEVKELFDSLNFLKDDDIIDVKYFVPFLNF